MSARSLPLLYLAQEVPLQSVPDRWSGFLPRDRDERNEIVGAAGDGFSCLPSISGFLLVAQGKNTFNQRRIVQETRPKANLPPSRKGGCRPPRCRTLPLAWKRRCRSRCGSPSRGWSCRMVFFSCGKRQREILPLFARKHLSRQCTSCPSTS